MAAYHTPVLLQSACALLDIVPGRKYLDATLGGGGHTQEILARGGLILALDQDEDAISACRQSEALKPALALHQLNLVHSNFTHLDQIIVEYDWQPLWGIIFDLGISSHQIDTPERGFSFQRPGPLDMRMDRSLTHTAATIVNTFPVNQLALLLSQYGEIGPSLAVAKKIVANRPYVTTEQLKSSLSHPQLIRQVFQAIRIAVNDELGAISSALPLGLDQLVTGGRIVVISFHSLEDRLVKQQFQMWQKQGRGEIITPHPVRPDGVEISQNPRSKSAKLRCFKKLI